MHILTAVYFNAKHGGLHDNVFSTVSFARKLGYKVTVICKEGPFELRLKRIGVNVITSDFSDPEKEAYKILKEHKCDFDIIHTHPGPSRIISLILAEHLDVPFFVTFHGMWQDKLKEYVTKASSIFVVSEGIKDYLKKHVTEHPEKFLVMPNGVNKKKFKPKKPMLFKHVRTNNNKLNIALVTRLDKDKEFIINIFLKALKYTNEEYPSKIKWTIVGDGSQQDDIETITKQITDPNNQHVEFVGWKTGKDLLHCYLDSDIVVAPGRCALEAMACGKPVIAIGSKNYVGLINEENWMNGVYTNFGGVGFKMKEYEDGLIEKDLSKVINDETLRKQLGELGIFITDQFYSEHEINKKIIEVYKMFYNQQN